MAAVFISYAREDSLKAKAVARALEQESLQVWMDERIRSGSEYADEIERALDEAAAVVVLWSQHSVKSVWVRDEATEARDSGRLIPVMLDSSRPPMGFRQFQATDLSRWSGHGSPQQIGDVVKAVREMAGAPATLEYERVGGDPGRWNRPILLAAAALALAALIAGLLLFARPGARKAQAPSIALLPFTADSADPVARKLASDTRDAVAHTLSQGAFSLRLVDSVPTGRDAADFILSGKLSSAADGATTTVRMENAAHRSLVFSDRFEVPRKDFAALPERIGAQVAARVAWTAPIIAIERRHPSDPAVLSVLLQQKIAVGQDESALQDYQAATRLADKAPNSAVAQMNVGFFTAYALGALPRAERAKAVAVARRATERARALAPGFGEPYIPWCLLRSSVRMVECEDNLRAAIRVDADAPFPTFFLSQLLNNAGRAAEAAQFARISLAHDQYMPMKIALMLRMLEATGERDEADELYSQSMRWWPDNAPIRWFRLSGMVMRGDFDAARKFAVKSGPEEALQPVLAAVARDAPGPLRAACPLASLQGFKGALCMLGFARHGDLDSAYALAELIYPPRRGRTPADEERIWLDDPYPLPAAFLNAPVAAPLRRDPRFVALADRIGLLRYWRSGRPPDFCRARPEPICRALLGRK